MKTLVIGMGEVGTAHFNIISKVYQASGYDIKTGWHHGQARAQESAREFEDTPFEIMHIATPWLGDAFVPMVQEYALRFKPKHISVLTSVVPGTCELIEKVTGVKTVHSTTRGLHPNLETGLRNITKHVAGPDSDVVASYFRKAGIPSITHLRAQTTEVAHILINIDYAVALAFADEKARICRHFGVDYIESVMDYTRTHNVGYSSIDHESKQRPVLTPPNGRIGGHCLVQNAQMLAPVMRKAGVKIPLVEMVEKYNEAN